MVNTTQGGRQTADINNTSQNSVSRWLHGQRPTRKQLDFLARLGYVGPTPATAAVASELINNYREALR